MRGVTAASADSATEAMRPTMPAAFLPVALVLVLYAPVLAGMVREWATLDEMSHGFLVPLVAGIITWQRRDKLRRIRPAPSWWGLTFVGWGFIQLVLGYAGADYFLTRTAFLISLTGVLWTIWGIRMVRALAFPLVLLIFMVRVPLFIYSRITLPLQILASQMAEIALRLCGSAVVRDGNILQLANQQLSVAEACSGIRSLLSLSFLSVMYAHFVDRRRWMLFVLLASSVPIAVVTNAARVTLIGLMADHDSTVTEGASHSLQGVFTFLAAICCLVLTHAAISRLSRVGRYASKRTTAAHATR